MKKRAAPRKVIDAFAACGNHGKPWVTLLSRTTPVGQIAVFDSEIAAAMAHGGRIHRVKIYIEREPISK